MPDQNQKLVKVNGLGVVSFPADMPDEDINDFIRTQLKAVQGRPAPQVQGHGGVHAQSPKNEFPIETEESERKRQSKSERVPKLPPLIGGHTNLAEPAMVGIAAALKLEEKASGMGLKTVKRKENWADREIPYGTGMAQVIASQAVGLSKIARAIDKSLGIGKPMVIGMGITHRIGFDENDVEIPVIKRFDEKMNHKIQDFAEEGPSNKEEARGQVIAQVAEFDLGEEELEAIADMISNSKFTKSVPGIDKIADYLKRYKALLYASKMSARTMKSSLLGGLQELVNNGGDVDRAVEEARASAKMGVLFEAGGLGASKALGSNLGREASALETATDEGRAVRGIEDDARREAQMENIDEYATVGITEDPLHTLVTPEPESPSDKAVVAGKKTAHILGKLSGEGGEEKKNQLTDAQKRRLNELRILNELRASTARLKNATGSIAP